MSTYLGDIRLGQTICFPFTTRSFTTGSPFTLAGTPALAAYIGTSTTEITGGITLTADFDSKTGINMVNVVATAANGYSANTNVSIWISTGTVNGVAVAGEVVGVFSIEHRSALMPTINALAPRTLDVSTTGEGGVDWANVGSPTTSLALTGTTIATTQKVDIETIKTNPVVNAGTVTFPTTATLASTTNITAGTITTVTTAVTVSGNVNGSVGSVVGAVGSVTGAVGSVTGNVGGNVVGSVGSVVGSVGGNVTGSVGSVVGAVGSVTGAVGSVTGNVGGNVNGNVVGTVASVVSTVDANIIQWRGSTPNVLIAGRVDANGQVLAAAVISSATFAASALDAAALATDAVNEIADGLLDRSNAIETGLTPRQALRLNSASMAGKLSGAATTTVTIRNAVADSKDRIVATVDADGNRTAITTDVS